MVRNCAALIFAVLAFGAASSALADPPAPQQVSRLNGGWTLGDFTFVDQHGKPFSREQLLGRWTLVLFGDTHCGEPCTAALSALAAMCQRIARTQKVKTTQVVFISLAGDTPEELRRYLAPFDEHFIGATGPPQRVKKLADDLGVLDTLPEPSGQRVAVASAHPYPGSLSVVDPNAIVWGEFLPPYDVPMLTARYLKARIGR